MTEFVESLKRLYMSGKITSKKLNLMLVENKITKEEYKFIISTN